MKKYGSSAPILENVRIFKEDRRISLTLITTVSEIANSQLFTYINYCQADFSPLIMQLEFQGQR